MKLVKAPVSKQHVIEVPQYNSIDKIAEFVTHCIPCVGNFIAQPERIITLPGRWEVDNIVIDFGDIPYTLGDKVEDITLDGFILRGVLILEETDIGVVCSIDCYEYL